MPGEGVVGRGKGPGEGEGAGCRDPGAGPAGGKRCDVFWLEYEVSEYLYVVGPCGKLNYL